MKTFSCIGLVLSLAACWLTAQIPDESGQTDGTLVEPGAGDDASKGGSDTLPGEWKPTRLNWSSTLWESSEWVTNRETRRVETRGLRFIEVGDGLNYLDPQGRWQPSEDSIQLMTNGGAAALRGPTKVFFPPKLGRQDEPLTLISASNTVLRVRPAGVYYTDYESGKSYLLGSVREVDGQLAGVNRIVYPAAVSDELTADIIYTYNKGIFESDLLILEQPRLAPQEVGLNPETTRLELVTLVEGDAPRRTPRVLKHETDPVRRARLGDHADFVDETLDYGPDLFFPMGRAFSVDGEPLGNPGTPGAAVQIRAKDVDLDEGELPVGKTWMQFDEQRQGLVEAVLWLDIEPKLSKLPKAGRRAEGPGTARQAERGRRLPKLAGGPRTPAKEMALAKTAHRASGVLLDYQAVSGTGPFTFANETYYVTNSITVIDSVTFGPSAVIKYGSNNYAVINISGNGAVTCTGTSVMTSENDDTYGTTLPWSTHVPRGSAYHRAVQLQQPTPVPRTLSGLRVRYAKGGLFLYGGGVANHTVTNCAFEESTNCQFAVYAGSSQVTLINSTVCRINTPPAITAQPQSQTVAVNASATLSVTASGSPAPSYLWQKNGVALPGKTQSSLTFNPVQTSDAGDYAVTVANTCDTVVSATAILTVAIPPSITQQPQSLDVEKGDNAIFNVAASGTGPFSYQWTFNGANIPGETSATLTKIDAQTSDAGAYAVVVSNSGGSMLSAPADLRVSIAPRACTPSPFHMVAWWPADGSPVDAAGEFEIHTTFNGPEYAIGKVNQGFSFYGGGNHVRVDASPGLDVGAANGFTFEAWVKPRNALLGPILEWASPAQSQYGVSLHVNEPGAGALRANIYGADGTPHPIESAAGLLAIGGFNHVALSYDKTR
jgi:hypothetical protein